MFDHALIIAALLTTALLFGGMLLFAGGFAALAFRALPPVEARRLIRVAFPPFYTFVLMASALAALLAWPLDTFSALALALIGITIFPTRQILMPAINRASDAGQNRRFQLLHGLSVLITLAHIGIAGLVLLRLAALTAS